MALSEYITKIQNKNEVNKNYCGKCVDCVIYQDCVRIKDNIVRFQGCRWRLEQYFRANAQEQKGT